jgi:hypothetical protein
LKTHCDTVLLGSDRDGALLPLVPNGRTDRNAVVGGFARANLRQQRVCPAAWRGARRMSVLAVLSVGYHVHVDVAGQAQQLLDDRAVDELV